MRLSSGSQIRKRCLGGRRRRAITPSIMRSWEFPRTLLRKISRRPTELLRWNLMSARKPPCMMSTSKKRWVGSNNNKHRKHTRKTMICMAGHREGWGSASAVGYVGCLRVFLTQSQYSKLL
nr:hypothetical protein Iba_chr14dCG19060 [Ipomoea batatas]